MDTLWPLVLSGGLGILGTLLGSWITQRSATKREAENWERELQREQARWLREDEAKTFDHRRVAYVEFFEALGKVQELVSTLGAGDASGYFELDEEWRYGAWKKLQYLALYATPGVGSLAVEAYNATAQWGDNAKYEDRGAEFSARQNLAEETKNALLKAIRADLRVPDAA